MGKKAEPKSMKDKDIFLGELPNFCGMEYLIAKNVPMYKTKWGEVVDLDPKGMERIAAKAIIEKNYPIRGKEVHLFRSALDLSLERFARELDLSAAGVLKWERNTEGRLSLPNEIAVRLYVAEKLKVPLELKWSHFAKIQDDKIEEVTVLKIGRNAS